MLVLWFVVRAGRRRTRQGREARVWESAGRARLRARCEAAEQKIHGAFGDPVIEDVMTCAEAAGGVGASVVLLNPDLGMKVALGIHQKDRWAAFVRSFAPAYHFSNWCSYERPSCRQIERGLVRYTHTGQWEASTRSRSWILSTAT